MISPENAGSIGVLDRTARNIASSLGEYFGRSDLFDDFSVNGLDITTDSRERSYSALYHHGVYQVDQRDLTDLEDDILQTNYTGDSRSIAVELYMGLGLAGTLVRGELERTRSNTRTYERKEVLDELFCDKSSITDAFKLYFVNTYGEAFSERAYMVNGMTDARAISVNGLRMRLLFLSTALNEAPALEAYKPGVLTGLAQAFVTQEYARNGATFTDISVVGLGQHPIEGDKMFFNTLPDWIIAALAPMRPAECVHLFSEAWKQDI